MNSIFSAYVLRSANRVAHWLALAEKRASLPKDWVSRLPQEFLDVLRADFDVVGVG